MTRKNYQLGGVTCQVCVNKIEKKVGKDDLVRVVVPKGKRVNIIFSDSTIKVLSAWNIK